MYKHPAARLLALLAFSFLLLVGCNSDDPVSPDPTGTIVINPSPDILNAPWNLVGPDSVNHAGTGDQTLNDLDPGTYTITWADIPDWTTPETETRSLDTGAIETFSGAYVGHTGIIVIESTPADLEFSWSLSGPADFLAAGHGAVSLSNMAAGEYSLTWGDAIDRVTPEAETLTLSEGEMLSFMGDYVIQTGIVLITGSPSFLNARWNLLGPSLYESGTGDMTMIDMPVGDYRVSWGPIPGWLSPSSQTQTLTGDGVAVFAGIYVEEAPGFANSEIQLMLNFQAAYEAMDFVALSEMLHLDFEMFLQQGTQQEFPDLGPTIDLTEMLRIAERMFSGEPVTDPDGSLVHSISSIRFEIFDRQGPWEATVPTDLIPNVRFAIYDVQFYLDRPGASTLKVEGALKFYAAGRDSVHNGSSQTYFEMVGQQDLTGGYKAVETSIWGTVNALFR